MNARDQIFQRIGNARSSRDTSAGPPDPAGELKDLHRRLQSSTLARSDGGEEQFMQRAEEAGATVLRCASVEDVADTLREIFTGLDSLAMACDAFTRSARLRERLPDIAPGIVLHEIEMRPLHGSTTAWKQSGARIDAGISSAVAGIADSGAVIIRSSDEESRTLSLLSPVHVVLLPAENILPSLMHAAPLLGKLTGSEGHSAVTLIGGPSKTADIEKVLITGVHGPGQFVIVVVGGISRDSVSPSI